MERIAFIGTGVMGRSMAGHLLAAGYPVSVYSRTKAKAAPLLEKGAEWRESPAEAVADAAIAITMLGFPRDVEAVYLGADSVMEGLARGALAIDMTTSSPSLARRLAELGAQRGIGILDAPVSGGDLGAREARLSIMVGGEASDLDRALPMLRHLGQNIVRQGPAGAGQHAKMCNQIAIAGGMVAIAESLAYARSAGLDPATTLRSISAGAAGSWTLSNLVPRALQGDFAPGFYVKHFIKDMGIALESAAEMDLRLPGLELAKRAYEVLAANGGAEEGTQALFRAALAAAEQ